jgi:hypothetical protein
LVKLAQVAALGTAAVLIAPASAGAVGAPAINVPAARDTEPVVLTGAEFPGLAVPANQTVKVPFMDLKDCQSFNDKCAHNHYAQPEIDTSQKQDGGPDVKSILGYRWQGGQWHQIPFQVDEVFTRYLDNSASGFAVYSGEDQHTSYAFDREGFRFNTSTPSDPCKALPDDGISTTPDPVKGLDTNDEMAFMASDAGEQAPSNAPLPKGIVTGSGREVRVTDPYAPSSARYVYVMQAASGGPAPAFSGSNGYVHYQRDANADTFEKSESSYQSYGNAARGPVCDKNGNVVLGPDGKPAIEKRRPRDYATITTPRYRFRYDGRWLMTQIQVAGQDGAYGPDLVDRWKARAFAQDPGSNTPCCGFEEEDTNWGGSSTLLGEKVGPVRAIRETWGADSGTNVIRRETFYRDEMHQKTWLRVHVIPPLDGIYSQWDFNAAKVTRYYNDSTPPAGVPIDGQDDDVGNFDDPCNPKYNGNPQDPSKVDGGYRTLYQAAHVCDLTTALGQISDKLNAHLSIDLTDPTFNTVNASLSWNEVAGQYGTIVDRFQIDKATDLTPGGAAQSLLAAPYYRDDSCFDDGTGADPGPKVHLRSDQEPTTAADGTTRKCWTPHDGDPKGSDHFFQGSIGTHGLHLIFLAESDNARQTVPLDEIVAEQRMVMVPGECTGAAGEKYGRGFEKPLLPVPGPFSSGAASADAGAPLTSTSDAACAFPAVPGGSTNNDGGNNGPNDGGGGGPSGGGGGQGTPPRVAASQKAGSPAATPTRRSAAARKRAAKRRRAAKRKRAARRHAKQNRRHA